MDERKIVNIKQRLFFLPISLSVLFLDQLTKKWIMDTMLYGDSKSIIGNIVRFTFIRNPNSVFGLRFGGPVISTSLTVIAFVFVLFLFFKSNNRFSLVSFSLIIGGAMGNLTDRIRYMEVVDFIDVGVTRWRWPTFNVADSFVTIGLILIVIYFLFIDTSHKEPNPQIE
ncbi:signal peptidase II [candidate division WOR-3 bacterium]|nr:signal peptidase II [candidate division WOR-3 bacterium]